MFILQKKFNVLFIPIPLPERTMELILGTYENFLLGYKYPSLEQTFNIHQHKNAVKSINVNNKGLVVSGGGDENVHLLNLKSRKEYGSLFSHNDKICGVHFSGKNDHLLYSTSEDGTIVRWEYKSHGVAGCQVC